MNRGEIRWYRFTRPDKKRPVLVLTRDSAMEFLGEVTIAPVTSTIRDIPAEVLLRPWRWSARWCTAPPVVSPIPRASRWRMAARTVIRSRCRSTSTTIPWACCAGRSTPPAWATTTSWRRSGGSTSRHGGWRTLRSRVSTPSSVASGGAARITAGVRSSVRQGQPRGRDRHGNPLPEAVAGSSFSLGCRVLLTGSETPPPGARRAAQVS